MRFIPDDSEESGITSAYIKEVPLKGALIGYKIGYLKEKDQFALIKLMIPRYARIVVSTEELNKKLRCSKAKVLDINPIIIDDHEIYIDENVSLNSAESVVDILNGVVIFFASQKPKNLIYEIGKTMRPDRFDSCKDYSCSHGIHFFLTRFDAMEYFIIRFRAVAKLENIPYDETANPYLFADKHIEFYEKEK